MSLISTLIMTFIHAKSRQQVCNGQIKQHVKQWKYANCQKNHGNILRETYEKLENKFWQYFWKTYKKTWKLVPALLIIWSQMIKFTNIVESRDLLLSTISTELACNGDEVNISNSWMVAAATCWRLDVSIRNCTQYIIIVNNNVNICNILGQTM